MYIDINMDNTNITNGKHNPAIKLISFNIRGLRNNLKRKRVFNWLQSQHADIIFLHETHTVQDDLNTWQNEWNGMDRFI